MKAIILIFSLVTGFAASATSSAISGANFASIKAAKATEQCPDNPQCKSHGTTRVEIVFGLNGCMDKFGGANWRYDKSSKTLYVSAINVSMKASESVKCKRQPTQDYVLTLFGVTGNVKIVDMSEDRE